MGVGVRRKSEFLCTPRQPRAQSRNVLSQRPALSSPRSSLRQGQVLGHKLQKDGVHALSSSLMVSQRIAASFGIECPDGVVDGLIEVAWSGEGLVSEVMPLQVAPETLDIVQLRSGFR